MDKETAQEQINRLRIRHTALDYSWDDGAADRQKQIRDEMKRIARRYRLQMKLP